MAKPKSIEEARIPQLGKIILLRLSAVHRPNSDLGQVNGQVRRDMTLELLEPKRDSSLCRLRALIAIDGTWRRENSDEPFIIFNAEYEARFLFPENISIEQASSWMDHEFYREMALAQMVPSINSHMHAQLEMMGIDTRNRPIGYIPSRDKTIRPAAKARVKTQVKAKTKTKARTKEGANTSSVKRVVSKKPKSPSLRKS